MSGRVFDLITAENFAKWAEDQARVEECEERQIFSTCVMANWLKSLGFADPAVDTETYAISSRRGRLTWEQQPDWMRQVVLAYDFGELSGPRLAKIARESDAMHKLNNPMPVAAE